MGATRVTPVNHANNFTALRLFAAFLVLYAHSFDLYKIVPATFINGIPLGEVGIDIFFAISGYLIAISWSREGRFSRFIYKRALRILPGLAVCVLLTIFVMGAWVTTLGWSEYLRHPVTLAYAKNMLLYINYTLPGVFEANVYPRIVNGSIWSLPVEFAMYLIFAAVSVLARSTGMHRAAVLGLAAVLFIIHYGVGTPEVVFYSFFIKYIALCGLYFLMGVIIHQWHLMRWASISSMVTVMVLWLSLSRWPLLFECSSYVLLPFLVIAFGTSASRLFTWLNKFDYSYGIYIYAFPVQQVISLYFYERGHVFGLFAAMLVTFCLGGLSWHLVEKPALRYKV